MLVLNRPSDLYTYESSTGRSEIDVTMRSRHWPHRCSFEWSLLADVGVSDHRVLQTLIMDADPAATRDPVAVVSRTRPRVVPFVTEGVRWRKGPTYWPLFEAMVRDAACEFADSAGADHCLSAVRAWYTQAADRALGRLDSWVVPRVRWWNGRLSEMRRETRLARRAVERARRRGLEAVDELARYAAASRRYKKAIYLSKRDGWRQFVRSEGNDNPWGAVYRVCRGRHTGRLNVGPLVVGGREYVEWDEMMEILLDRFFRADPGPVSAPGPASPRSMLRVTPALVEAAAWPRG